MSELCPVCNQEFPNSRLLGSHVSRNHTSEEYHLSSKLLYDSIHRESNLGKCRNCGNLTPFVSLKIGYRTFCSKECQSSGKQGEGNPFFNKKHSNDTRERLSKIRQGSNQSIETRHKISESGIGKHNHSEETRAKISEAVSSFIINHPEYDWGKNRNYKRGYAETRFGKFYYRSSYELKALQLFSENPNIKEIRYEKLRIPIKTTLGIRWTIPDYQIFMNDGSYTIIEIKPKKLISHSKNKSKIEQIRKYCSERNIKFEVWSETELGING